MHRSHRRLFSGYQITFDNDGNAFVIWKQGASSGSESYAQTRRYDVTAGTWSAIERIDHAASQRGMSLQIATDASGNAIAVWEQFDGTNSHVLANRYNATTGYWITAQQIEASASNAWRPALAVKNDGDALIVWNNDIGFTNVELCSKRYDATADTRGPVRVFAANPVERLDLIGTAPLGGGSASFNAGPGGEVIAIWPKSDGTQFNLLASHLQ